MSFKEFSTVRADMNSVFQLMQAQQEDYTIYFSAYLTVEGSNYIRIGKF